MTENQEKELFKILNNLVTTTKDLVTSVKEIREVQDEHSAKFEEVNSKFEEVNSKFEEVNSRLDEHGETLKLVLARTNDVAKTVINHENRLTTVEKEVAEIRSGIH